MKVKFQRKLLAASLMAVSAGVAIPAFAQSTEGKVMALEEIVVTARRREESLQSVPLSVNAVTADQIDDLNVRKFEDIQGIVAGLTLTENTVAPNASLRGARFDTFISGNNPTVEFYLNDAPIDSQSMMQAMFDIGQIEVLRGPQGTLRGRASPSGSITVTSQRPVLDEFGGYVDTTVTDIGGQNVKAAVNAPIIEDMLAVRVAGFWEENEANQVKSIYTGDESEYEGSGYRISVAFEPLDTLSFNAMYQMVEPDRIGYTAVESANIANPSLPASDILIKAKDRHAVQDLAQTTEMELETFILQATWEVGGQSLNYVGSRTDIANERVTPNDLTNALDATFFSSWQGAANTQILTSTQEKETHEVRLQSVDPLFDKIEYVVGALYNYGEPPSTFTRPTLLRTTPTTGSVNITNIARLGESTEKSVFANITYLIGESTELSGGLRRIDYEDEGRLVVGGVAQAALATAQEEQTTIYSTSLKHQFNDDVMAYVSFGTSWRPGATAIGDTSLSRSALQQSFYQLEPEESESFEIGTKTTWMDDRLRVNGSIYHQEFDNFPYRSATPIFYRSFVDHDRNPATAPVGTVATHNFGAAVPVEVNGIEVETFFQATDSLDLGALFSYSKGEIDNGTVPCNDYQPTDGNPDRAASAPSLATLVAASGTNNLMACQVTQRSNYAPLWTGTLTSEYSFTVGNLDAYVRGLWTFYGSSKNDPTNSVDDIDAYNILNLYAGVEDPEGVWAVMLYGKNIADTVEVIDRQSNAGSQSFLAAPTFQSVTVVSDYREVTLSAPREFGINLKYNF